jgi:hypothetical protein
LIASIVFLSVVVMIGLAALIHKVHGDSYQVGYDLGLDRGRTVGWDKGYGEGSRDALEEASEQITKLLQDIGDED